MRPAAIFVLLLAIGCGARDPKPLFVSAPCPKGYVAQDGFCLDDAVAQAHGFTPH